MTGQEKTAYGISLLAGQGSGCSTMFHHMMNAEPYTFGIHAPKDAQDIMCCLRMVAAVDGWKERLPEMMDYQGWPAFVGAWAYLQDAVDVAGNPDHPRHNHFSFARLEELVGLCHKTTELVEAARRSGHPWSVQAAFDCANTQAKHRHEVSLAEELERKSDRVAGG